MAVGHIFGTLTNSPTGGLWCSRCGYEQLSAFGQADCGGSSPSGNRMHPDDWTNDPVKVAELKQSFIDAQLSNAQSQSDTVP